VLAIDARALAATIASEQRQAYLRASLSHLHRGHE
jgi:hypothetical protein